MEIKMNELINLFNKVYGIVKSYPKYQHLKLISVKEIYSLLLIEQIKTFTFDGKELMDYMNSMINTNKSITSFEVEFLNDFRYELRFFLEDNGFIDDIKPKKIHVDKKNTVQKDYDFKLNTKQSSQTQKTDNEENQ